MDDDFTISLQKDGLLDIHADGPGLAGLAVPLPGDAADRRRLLDVFAAHALAGWRCTRTPSWARPTPISQPARATSTPPPCSPSGAGSPRRDPAVS